MSVVLNQLSASARRRRVGAVIAALSALGITAPAASAAYDFHNGAVGSGGIEQSNFEALRATLGWADSPSHKAQVGAGSTSGLYGSWVDGYDTACHGYAGTTVLRGLLRNPHSVTQNPYRGRVRVAPEIACGDFGRSADPVSAVPAELADSFAIFRERKASPVPDEVVKTTIGTGAFGANVNLAREIPTTTGTGWVVPADQKLCIIQADGVNGADGYGLVCTANQQVLKAGLYIGLRKDLKAGDATNTFLVPDGAQLEQTDTDGNTKLAVGAARLTADLGVTSTAVPNGSTLQVTRP